MPMKKAAVIIQEKDAESALKILRQLGILHLEPQRIPKSKEPNEIQNDIALVEASLSILSETEFKSSIEQPAIEDLPDWQAVSRHIIDLKKRLEHLEQFSRNLKNIISQWEKWGDFDTDKIHELAKNNIFIRFYRIPHKEFKKLPDNILVKIIFNVDGIANCLVVSREKCDIGFKELVLPHCGLEKMRLRLQEDVEIIKSIEREIGKFEPYFNVFTKAKKNLIKELEFQQALSGMAQEWQLNYLMGYIPYDKVKILTETAKKEKWGLVITQPAENDNVPTLIRNPRWVAIIAPVFKLIEIFPGYREVDISMLFLVFLSIFFGMLIGDAGYGAIFLFLTIFARIKTKKKIKDKSIFILFYVFSGCAIIWGGLSATFFGQEWLPQSIKPLVPGLRDSATVQTICFLLGTFHLSLGHIWRFILKMPSLIAWVEIGWLCILWGMFFLARNLILSAVFPAFAKWFFIIGPVLVVLFSNPQKNILKGIGAGLGNLLLNFVNNFTDVVSYIRLFAVGLATVAVADAFNKMAMDVGYNSLVSAVTASLILLLGHGLNIVLGPMAVLVHGVRLNVLEFCNHINVKWQGFVYKPIQE
ncbi:MAG: hypothetical protein ABIH18_06425 [Candidatus Omnitrophota bacterium]